MKTLKGHLPSRLLRQLRSSLARRINGHRFRRHEPTRLFRAINHIRARAARSIANGARRRSTLGMSVLLHKIQEPEAGIALSPASAAVHAGVYMIYIDIAPKFSFQPRISDFSNPPSPPSPAALAARSFIIPVRRRHLRAALYTKQSNLEAVATRRRSLRATAR